MHKTNRCFFQYFYGMYLQNWFRFDALAARRALSIAPFSDDDRSGRRLAICRQRDVKRLALISGPATVGAQAPP
jgi:hypothetical protein